MPMGGFAGGGAGLLLLFNRANPLILKIVFRKLCVKIKVAVKIFLT
jgi:hypothetical protein